MKHTITLDFSWNSTKYRCWDGEKTFDPDTNEYVYKLQYSNIRSTGRWKIISTEGYSNLYIECAFDKKVIKEEKVVVPKTSIFGKDRYKTIKKEYVDRKMGWIHEKDIFISETKEYDIQNCNES